MKDLVKGWFLSLVGLILIAFTVGYFFGYKPSFMPVEGAYMPKPLELLTSFVIGLFLIRMPATKIDELMTKLIEKFIKSNKDNEAS